MKKIKHSEMVSKLVKDPKQIHYESNSGKLNRVHMAIGIAGEAGELLDAIKKEFAYNKALDTTNVIEELGDLEFYMEGLRQDLGITRQECLDANIAKLGERYKKFQYTNEAAHARADKVVNVEV